MFHEACSVTFMLESYLLWNIVARFRHITVEIDVLEVQPITNSILMTLGLVV